eukprot:7509465-Pyramimonas_sp.AAC.1
MGGRLGRPRAPQPPGARAGERMRRGPSGGEAALHPRNRRPGRAGASQVCLGRHLPAGAVPVGSKGFESQARAEGFYRGVPLVRGYPPVPQLPISHHARRVPAVLREVQGRRVRGRLEESK